MQIENENLFRHTLSSGINLFLGAGFSMYAHDKDGIRLPIGKQLKDELITEFEVPGLVNLDLAQICTVIASKDSDSLDAYVRSRFTVGDFPNSYYSLENVKVSTIFTTNIDDLIYKIYSGSKKSYINDITIRGPVFEDRNAIDLVTLHGSVAHENDTLVFTTLDIATSFSSDPDRWHLLSSKLQQQPTLFWGYSVEDAGTLRALSPTTSAGRDHKPRWILLHEDNESSLLYFRALGFQVIVGNTEEMLHYLTDLAYFSRGSSLFTPLKQSTNEIFPDEAIPAVGAVPVRPIVEFYLGAPPTWYDVFSGNLHITIHQRKILDLIYSGTNLVVLGIPACGKTTLLMQTAANTEYNGHKLFIEQLTIEKARYILNKLNGHTALVFVDNCASDIDGFLLLMSAGNVLTVGFDRDYFVEQTSHKLSNQDYKVLDVTEQEASDIQAIFNKIPREIRNNRLRIPNLPANVSPSLFEIVETNVKLPRLQSRFKTILRDLAHNNILLHDMLVMMCYVSAGRVPVTYDTLSAFLRGDVVDYAEVLSLQEKLGGIISDYYGPFVEDGQDHLIPRSTIVGETVLDGVSQSSFKRVLLRFHDQVSPWRICRYDVFKKRAFDKDYARKAFEDWEEGAEFYTRMYKRDQSPYLLQQGALFLKGQGRYTDAFEWIDRALAEGGYKHPSIRNSHAVILFDANIRYAGMRTEVRKTLDKSMDILEECYLADSRKRYHTMRYADQAIRYSQFYSDETSAKYLHISESWLEKEELDREWDKGVKRLRAQVQRALLRFY